eukprot:scaffold44388_cov63-Phaeocystis_antarctica.AAC.15
MRAISHSLSLRAAAARFRWSVTRSACRSSAPRSSSSSLSPSPNAALTPSSESVWLTIAEGHGWLPRCRNQMQVR